MRKLIPMLMTLAFATAAFANDEHHPEGDKKAAAPATQTIKSAPKKTAASTEAEKQFAAAQEQMKKMMAQMDKIRQTKDPKERQRLMQEHMKTMQEGAQAMRGTGGGMMMNMMDCPMMGKKDDKGGAQSCPMMGGATGKMDTGKRVDMMEKRMDMMQMMMEQMIEREGQKSLTPSTP